jgi:FG-GAP-like repeat/Putative metal-binding motif
MRAVPHPGPGGGEESVKRTGPGPSSPRCAARSLPRRGRPRLALVILCLLSVPAWATEIGWFPEVALTTASDGARSVVACDLDGDGDQDMVVASVDGDTVEWLENTAGDGSSWTVHPLASANGAWDVHPVDLDGDGDQDVLSVAFFDNEILWHENTLGDASAWTNHLISVGIRPTSVGAGDLDGDGDADVVAAVLGESSVLAFENDNGDGSSWTTRVVSPLTLGPQSIHVADMDADGDADILSVTSTDDLVSFHENIFGDGVAWAKHLVHSGSRFPKSVTSGDMDGDGDLDILSAHTNDDLYAWHENTGVAFTWIPHVIAIHLRAPSSVLARDLDGDGDLDVLTTSANDNNVSWHENVNGDGSAFFSRSITSDASAARSVYAADLDGDGDLDVLSASLADDKVAWYPNGTIHRRTRYPGEEPLSGAPAGLRVVRAVDVDADGDLDVVSASDGSLSWHENLGPGGTSWVVNPVATLAAPATSLQTVDVNRDGDPDLLHSHSGTDPIVWHERGASAWTSHVIFSGNAAVLDAVPGDIDGDGDVDVVAAAGGDDDTVAWMENIDSDGLSWTLRPIAGSIPEARSASVVDLDRDGDLDVVIASSDDDSVRWFENSEGDGSAWVTYLISATTPDAWSVMAIDLDRDGDVDVLASSHGDDTVAWLENTAGDGTSWTRRIISSAISGAVDVGARDLDGDGDLDVTYASELVGSGALENVAGDETLWAPFPVPSAGTPSRSVTTADLDRDGVPDLIAAHPSTDSIVWYPDRGGQFDLTATDMATPLHLEGTEKPVLRIEVAHQGRAADPDLELAALELVFDDGAGEPYTSTEVNALLDNLLIYLDDGSGLFEIGVDSLVSVVSPLELAAGSQLLTFLDDDSSVRLRAGDAKTFFVTVDVAMGAASLDPNMFTVTHQSDATTRAENILRDVPLLRDAAMDESSVLVTIVSDGDNDGIGPGQDCDDANPAVFPGAAQLCDGVNNDCNDVSWPVIPPAEADLDADGFLSCSPYTGRGRVRRRPVLPTPPPGVIRGGSDCNDDEAATYPGAPEVNDGLDNQCPGDPGFGLVDEIQATVGFLDPDDPDALWWAPQAGATLYQVLRSPSPLFDAACLTSTVSSPVWVDPELPAPGGVHFYLVRALAPDTGTWGASSVGVERVIVCP